MRVIFSVFTSQVSQSPLFPDLAGVISIRMHCFILPLGVVGGLGGRLARLNWLLTFFFSVKQDYISDHLWKAQGF
ncbi:hypothetical protein VTO42DRAFT_5651 [Malbranchea cinnamomea]